MYQYLYLVYVCVSHLLLQTLDGIKYEAESPDEAALVVAAKAMGFFFFKRTDTSVTIRETTKAGTRDVEYEVRQTRLMPHTDMSGLI